MKKRIVLLMILLIKMSYSNLDISIKNTPKDISVDIIAEINRELTITNEVGERVRELTFNHGKWNVNDLGAGNALREKVQINGAPLRGSIKFEIKGELRSKGYLVHEEYNDIKLINNNNSWNPGVSTEYVNIILPHEYLLNIDSGVEGTIIGAELSYSSNYSNQGGIVVRTIKPFEINNEKIDIDIVSQLQGFWGTIHPFDKYPGRYYNRSTLKIIINQP